MENNRYNKILIPSFLCVVIIAASYASTIFKPFMWDDLPFILYEKGHRDLSNIPSFFAQDQHMLYRPLRSVAYTLTYAAFQYNPIPYRFIAITLHILTALLFAAIARRLGLSRRTSVLAGLIFGLHPVHADRVANTTGAFDIPGLMLGYAAFAVWLDYRSSGRRKDLILSAFLLALGLLSSEECATIPLLIAAWIWFDDGQFKQSKDRGALIATLGLLAGYLALRTLILGQMARVDATPLPSLAVRMLTMSKVFWHEAAKAVFPFSLRPVYYVDLEYSIGSIKILAAVAGLAAAAVYLFKMRGSKKIHAFGLAWFFIALAPFSNIIPGDTFMAERYLYSPLGGLILVACAAIEKSRILTTENRPRQALAKAMIASCLFLMAIFTFNRGYIWSDEFRLWADAFQKDDKAGLILVNYANQVKHSTIPEDPCPLYERAVKLNPNSAEGYVGAGECAVRHGELDKALELLRRSYELSSGGKVALEGLSQLFVLRKEMDKAHEAAKELLEIDPDSLVAHYVLGYIQFQAGDKDKALQEFIRVVESDESRPDIVQTAERFIALLKKQDEQ